MRTFYRAVLAAIAGSSLAGSVQPTRATRWAGLGPKQRRVNTTNARLPHQGEQECARRRKQIGAI